MKTNGTSHGDIEQKIASLVRAIGENEWKLAILKAKHDGAIVDLDERVEKLERQRKKRRK